MKGNTTRLRDNNNNNNNNILDADELRDYIILNSQYNLVNESMQSRENYFVLPNQSLNDIPRDVENIRFNKYGNDRNLTVLDFASMGFTNLRSIRIGYECFQYVERFVIDGLERLETVEIGTGCFVYLNNERTNGLFRIANCPNLIQLETGFDSFAKFAQFELCNVNSLQSIKFGEGCFRLADCVLKGTRL